MIPGRLELEIRDNPIELDNYLITLLYQYKLSGFGSYIK